MSGMANKLIDWAEKNPWQCVGILGGFLVGLLVILIGFWQTLFIVLMATFGYFLGKGKDEGKPLSERIRGLHLKERIGRGKEE